jgi:hypothetical protein
MTTLRTYAQMADNVYKVPDPAGLLRGLSGWRIFSHGQGETEAFGGKVSKGVTGSGFKGCIYVSSTEVVVCYKGSFGGVVTSIRDALADVSLAMGFAPRVAVSAKNLFAKALKVFDQKLPITLVGHSLGGGLCQLVGFWYDVRYVAFNPPPMGGCIIKSNVNVLRPTQLVRSLKKTAKAAVFGASPKGKNYRIRGDLVSASETSAFGHFGEMTEFNVPSVGNPLTAHLMTTFLDYLERSSDGSVDPFG